MEEICENNGDITLDFHSTSAKIGHFGSSTDYIAAAHRVVRRTWGTRRRFYDLLPPKVLPPTAEYMDIPEDITTEAEIRDYLHYHRGQWVKLPQEPVHQPRKQNAVQWVRFALTLCAFGLWMLFVVDYWNHSIAYTKGLNIPIMPVQPQRVILCGCFFLPLFCFSATIESNFPYGGIL